MTRWLLAALIATLGAWLAYGALAGRGRSVARRPVALALGTLRGAAYLLLLAILLGAPFGRPTPTAPLVVLDVSASWQRAVPPSYWAAARESVATLAADSVLLTGDSARTVAFDELPDLPSDTRSAVRPALEVAQSLQRAVVVLTDGEPDDGDAWRRLPPGSRVLVLPRPPAADVGIASLEAPTLATGGDTIDLVVGAVAGGQATDAGRLLVTLDGEERAAVPLAPLEAGAGRRVAVRVPVPRGDRPVELAAIVAVPGDVDARNDTLRQLLEVSDRPRAVFVSTAPDLDVREVLRVLRGTLSVPTRAYLRVAPGVWREEGTLAPIAEAEVQRRARDAGLLVLHGDTAWGGLVAARRGPLVAWAAAPPPPPARAGVVATTDEWFVTRAPPSPLAAPLDVLPFDSLPPLALGAGLASGMPLLEAQLARRGPPRTIASVTGDGARRQVRVVGSGFAGWVQRGGRSADAFSALWGAIFDWSAAAEGAVGGVRLARQPVRAGEPLVWRRGTADTLVTLVIERLAAGAAVPVDTVTLRFAAGVETRPSPPLPEGRYRLRVGDEALGVLVNPSREWVPRAPLAADGAGDAAAPPTAGVDRAPLGPAQPLRESAWPFVAALLLLCAEWLARRAVGLR